MVVGNLVVEIFDVVLMSEGACWGEQGPAKDGVESRSPRRHNALSLISTIAAIVLDTSVRSVGVP